MTFLPYKSVGVSIHAPVMDAIDIPFLACIAACFNPRARDGRDARRRLRDLPNRVSIHAPVMDAISTGHHFTHQIRRFNPRARDGRDNQNLYAYV